MFQNHIVTCPRHLLIAIIIGIFTHQREGVALEHLHMAESLERVAGFVEIGTVAVQSGTLMGELYLAVQDGGIGVLILVEVEHVGMNQVDTCILYLGLTRLAFPGLFPLLGTSRCHCQ